MDTVILYIYLFIALIVAVYLTIESKSSHKYLTFLIVFWILAHSVLNTEYFIIDIPNLPFDFQPNRILFIFLSLFLIFSLLRFKRRIYINAHLKNPLYEKYLYSFIFFLIIIDFVHTADILSLKELIVNATAILNFLLIYLVIKKTADIGMITAFIKALLFMTAISSLISIYQFFVNPLFFRLGSERIAYGIMVRPNGIFTREYFHSYFLISGIIVALLALRNKKIKFILIPLNVFGIAITFHRMSWIITILIFFLYFLSVKKKRIWQLAPIGLLTSAIVLSVFITISPRLENVINRDLVEEGFFRDTVSQRIRLFETVLKHVPQSWLIGFGSKKSDVYYNVMLNAGLPESFAKGEEGGIHNMYLDIMFFRGVPILIIYLIFIFFTFRYFYKLAKYRHIFYFIIFLEISKFFLSNFTNTFDLASDLGLLLAIFLGIGISVYQKKIDPYKATI